MVVTTDPAVYARMKLFRNHGMQAVRYRHELAGLNFRLTNLQAALGCAQLEAFEMIVAHRKRIHAQYRKQLGAAPGVTLQQFSHDVDPVLWACAVRLDPAAFPQGRDTVMQELKEAGIESRPGFYSPTTMPSIYGECRSIPVSDRISREVLSLPTFATLSPDQIEAISSALVKLRR
jgi:perosamine synthetase